MISKFINSKKVIRERHGKMFGKIFEKIQAVFKNKLRTRTSNFFARTQDKERLDSGHFKPGFNAHNLVNCKLNSRIHFVVPMRKLDLFFKCVNALYNQQICLNEGAGFVVQHGSYPRPNTKLLMT